MRRSTFAASAAAVSASLAAIGVGTAANATILPVNPVQATATTLVSGRLDPGDSGNNWAVDTIIRKAVITRVGADSATADCGKAAASCYAYTGTITDTGTARALAGQTSPGAQGVAIKGSPVASLTGHAMITFHASSSRPDANLVPARLSGNTVSDTAWVEQFFPAGTTFGAGPALASWPPAWSWTYRDAADCQTWVQARNVSQSRSGDITGVDSCPVLSGGRAVATRARATVTWKSTRTSAFQVTIAGAVPLDGRTARVTRPRAVYSGLRPGHVYRVRIQPLVDGAPAGKSGTVTFRTMYGVSALRGMKKEGR